MKKVLSLLAIALLVCATLSVSAQENQEKKISYNMINEYGFYLGGGTQQTNVGLKACS